MAELGAAQVCESSLLAAPPDAVWQRVGSMPGVNAELAPLLAMTFPARWQRLTADAVAADRPVFRSVILLFGIVPIDVHSVGFASMEPGSGFLERSSSLLHSSWIHERRLVPVGGGTRITDRVHFRNRLPIPGAMTVPLMRFVFRHRHRRLRRHFGAAR